MEDTRDGPLHEESWAEPQLSSFVQDGTELAPPETYEMTSSGPHVCVFQTGLTEADSIRVKLVPGVLWWDLCSQPSTIQLD